MAVYSASAKLSGVNASGIIFHLQAGATTPLRIFRISVGNGSNEDNEQLELQVRRTTGTPSGGTALTEAPRDVKSTAAAASARSGAVTGTTGGNVLEHVGFPSLGGWSSGYVPEEYPTVAAGEGVSVSLINAPSALDLVVQITWEE